MGRSTEPINGQHQVQSSAPVIGVTPGPTCSSPQQHDTYDTSQCLSPYVPVDITIANITLVAL